MRTGSMTVLAAIVLACSGDRAVAVEGLERSQARRRELEDPREACVRAHARTGGAHAGHDGVVRALCAELHDHGGVSASVAIVRDDRLVWSMAMGPRCRGKREGLRADAPLRIGSITKLVTAALALVVAEREGVGLDAPLTSALPELSPAPTLRQLLSHTSGLRDPEPAQLLSHGDAWPTAVQQHRHAAGEHVYANANFLLVGRWLEQTTGRSFAQLWAQEPALAGVRTRVGLDPASATGRPLACAHRPGRSEGWEPAEPSVEPPLPAWTLPAGGGLASAEGLAHLPFALERTGVLATMLTTRVPSDLPGWDYGLGVRMHGQGDALVLAHSGNTGTHWAEVQWSPKSRVAVAVVSSTPQAFKATLLAAFTAAMTAGAH